MTRSDCRFLILCYPIDTQHSTIVDPAGIIFAWGSGRRYVLLHQPLLSCNSPTASVKGSPASAAPVLPPSPLVLIDRDVVELTNLQRQTLFATIDVGRAKVEAATERLRAIDPAVAVEARAADLHAGTLDLLVGADVILDGTDNAATRYLLNDHAVKYRVPLVYGGCIGTEGRALAVVPDGPCLRCVFPSPPAAGEAATCDVAGVLGPAAAVAAAWQAGLALRLLAGLPVEPRLLTFDLATGKARTPAVERRPDCPCCGRGEFPFLDADAADTVTLCGRGTVQVRGRSAVDLVVMRDRWQRLGDVRATRHLLKLALDGRTLTLFADGRLLVQGTEDPAVARSLHDRYVGR